MILNRSVRPHDGMRRMVVCAYCSFLFLLIPERVCQAQGASGLKDVAASKNIRFGFSLAEFNPHINPVHPLTDEIVLRDSNIATMTAYWWLPNYELAQQSLEYGGPVIDLGPKLIKSNDGMVKSRDIAPGPAGYYNFRHQHAMLAYCERRNQMVHGHVLLWAQDPYVPPWVIEQLNVAPSVAIAAIERHVSTVVKEFRGRVHVWDVVNEAYDTDGSLRDSVWSRTLKYQFIDVAFRAAKLTDPTAILLYNDFSLEDMDPRRFEAVLAMVRRLQRAGVPIDGIGWQLHTNTTDVLSDSFPLLDRLNRIRALGLQNWITELDITVPNATTDANGNGTPAALELQRLAYQKITQISVLAQVSAIQTWGISDIHSWLGAERFPLLFDRQYRFKPAYYGVLESLR